MKHFLDYEDVKDTLKVQKFVAAHVAHASTKIEFIDGGIWQLCIVTNGELPLNHQEELRGQAEAKNAVFNVVR